MQNTRLNNLRAFLKSLGEDWKPNGGTAKIPKIWDPNRRQFNLSFFASKRYTAILKTEETFDYLLELDNEEQARAYYKWNSVGNSEFVILDLDSGLVVAEYLWPDNFGNPAKSWSKL
jgi:hypothetical protein